MTIVYTKGIFVQKKPTYILKFQCCATTPRVMRHVPNWQGRAAVRTQP
jgi:hypothetical protein